MIRAAKEGSIIATWEYQLLSRIISSGDINSVLQWGISQDDFQTSECRTVFNHIVNYYQQPNTAGSVIGPNAMSQVYPTFQLVGDASMTVDSLCTEVRKTRIQTELRVLMQTAEQSIEIDPAQALNLISSKAGFLQQLGTSKKMDVHAVDAMHRIMQRYDMKERGIDLSVCPFPWDPLQEATGGLEPDDYVCVYGRPKSMKSWVLAYLICWAYFHGKKTLIYTKEMTPDNIIQRVVALMAKVRYHEFRRGRLSPQEKQSIYGAWHHLHNLREQQSMVCLSGMDAGEGGDTVPWLRSKVEEYNPDIVFIDGMYLMSNARSKRGQKDNERVRDISRDLRQMILQTRKPLVCTLQANRDAAKNNDANLDEIAFSDSIGMDTTLSMRVINEKDQPTLALIVGGSREFLLDGFRIYGVPAYNFDYYGPLTSAEAQRVKDSDVNDATKAAKKAKRSGGQTDKTPEQLQAESIQAIQHVSQELGV